MTNQRGVVNGVTDSHALLAFQSLAMSSAEELLSAIKAAKATIDDARPTAVNLVWGAFDLLVTCGKQELTGVHSLAGVSHGAGREGRGAESVTGVRPRRLESVCLQLSS